MDTWEVRAKQAERKKLKLKFLQNDEINSFVEMVASLIYLCAGFTAIIMGVALFPTFKNIGVSLLVMLAGYASIALSSKMGNEAAKKNRELKLELRKIKLA